MIAPTQDKKEHTEAIQGLSQPTPSYIPIIPNIDPSKEEASHAFMYKFISKQIKEAKLRLKESQNPRTLVQVGDMYFLSHNYKKAVNYFLMAIELDPNFISVYEKIILAYLTHKDFNNANKFLLKLLKVTGRRSDVLHRYAMFKAFIYKDNQDPEEALSILDEILKKDPSNFEVINTYGFVLLNVQNKTEEAKKYFEKAIEINKLYPHSLNNLGVCYLKEKNFKQAQKCLLSVVETTPSYIFSYQNLACSYIAQEAYKDAYDILKNAQFKQLKLDNIWEHKIGWLLIMLKKTEEAIIWYEKKITEEPQNDLLYNNLGVCFNMLQLNDKAEQYFIKAVSVFKGRNLKLIRLDQLISFYNLARLAIDKGDTDTLDKISKDILTINPNDAFGKYLRGAYYSMLQNFSKAEEMFKEALSIDRKIPELYPDYGFILESINKDLIGAIKLLKEAVGYNFRSPLIDNNLAFAYIKNNELEKAENLLKKYKDENMPGVLFATKGLLEFKKNNLDKANEYYTEAVSKLTGKNSKLANQIWLYERAQFWFNKGNVEKAKEDFELAKTYPRSYITDDLIIFEENFKIKE